MSAKRVNSFDIDGVIFMGNELGGVYPGPSDVIITGRSYQERQVTMDMLRDKGINNPVFFNELPFSAKTRESSGEHKAKTIEFLRGEGLEVQVHFEDDEVQADVIKKRCPWVRVVLLQHDLVEKENVWHGRDDEKPID